MSAVFISDVHLRDPKDAKTSLMIRFLQEVAARYDEIYILGDFFDVWPMTSPFLTERFKRVLDTLGALVKGGHKVYYFEGNHDFHLGDHFTQELGIEVYKGSAERNWDGKRIYLAHGDLGNPAERGYRVLRRILRSVPVRLALKLIPGSVVHQLSETASRASRNAQDYEKQYESTRSAYRAAVQNYFQEGFDVVIFGHTHIPEDFKVTMNGKTHRYLNTGDWVRNFTYIVYEDGEFLTQAHSNVKSS